MFPFVRMQKVVLSCYEHYYYYSSAPKPPPLPSLYKYPDRG